MDRRWKHLALKCGEIDEVTCVYSLSVTVQGEPQTEQEGNTSQIVIQ